MLRKTVIQDFRPVPDQMGVPSSMIGSFANPNISAVERFLARLVLQSSVPGCGNWTVCGQAFTRKSTFSEQVHSARIDLQTSVLNVLGHFRRIASHQLAGSEEQKSQEWVSCFVKIATGGTEPSSLPFIAQLDRRKEYRSYEGHDLNMQFPIERIVCIDETTDQVFSKLLPHMRSTIFHPSYGEPPLLSSQTFGMIVQLEVFKNYSQSMKGSKTKMHKQDKLLTQSFNLWSLTQVIISGPDDFDISLHPSDSDAKDQLQQPGQAEESREPIPRPIYSRHTIAAQLQAAAEQGACDISKDIMVELEKRLERKERCQGFETFFVGVILLNCVERMCWAIKRASLTEEAQDVCSSVLQFSKVPFLTAFQCTFERPIETYIEQAAHFAEFLSKLFQMRGILADVRPNPENGVLQGGPRNTPTVDQWLSEMQFTSKFGAFSPTIKMLWC